MNIFIESIAILKFISTNYPILNLVIYFPYYLFLFYFFFRVADSWSVLSWPVAVPLGSSSYSSSTCKPSSAALLLLPAASDLVVVADSWSDLLLTSLVVAFPEIVVSLSVATASWLSIPTIFSWPDSLPSVFCVPGSSLSSSSLSSSSSKRAYLFLYLSGSLN